MFSALLKRNIFSISIRAFLLITVIKARDIPIIPTLENYILLAQKQNAGLQSAYKDWESAINQISVKKGLPNPTLSFGYFLENIETAVGPQEMKIGITQMVPWFGKLKTKGEIQAFQVEILFQMLQQKRLTLEHKIRTVYYDYYYLTKAINITKQNIVLVQNWEWVIQSKYITAKAKHPDFIKTQIELINLQDELASLKAKEKPIIQQFQSLLNDESITEIHLLDSLLFEENTFFETGMTENNFVLNPTLISAEQSIYQAQSAEKQARLNFFPDFGFGIESIGTGSKSVNGFPVTDSGKDPLVFKVSLSLPLWFNNTSQSVKSAKKIKQSTVHEKQEILNRLKAEWESEVFNLSETKRKLVLYRDVLLPKSMESLGASEKAYISDTVDFLTLIDAQRRHLKFKLKYEESLVKYLKSKSKLNTLIGKEGKGD